jgi:hypothetical protein
LGWIALLVCGTGTVLIAAAPFLGNGAPIMSNYVPVLDSPVFIAGQRRLLRSLPQAGCPTERDQRKNHHSRLELKGHE